MKWLKKLFKKQEPDNTQCYSCAFCAIPLQVGDIVAHDEQNSLLFCNVICVNGYIFTHNYKNPIICNMRRIEE